MPSPLHITASEGSTAVGVIIGMDPHKRSATIEVIDEAGRAVAVGRFGTDKAGYAELLAAGRRHEDRVWAVEGCNGIGKHIAHRLVHDGETVVVNRLHRLLLELFPGGAKRFLSAAQPSSARTAAKSAPIPLERPTTTHVSPRNSRSIPALPSS
jgi:hypothetical protein